jgi:hypothetical protein
MNPRLILLSTSLLLSVQMPSRTPTATELLDKYTRALEARQSFISKSEVLSRQNFRFDAGFDPAYLGTAEAVDKQGLELHLRVEFRTDGRRTRRILYMWGDTGIYSSHDEARPSYFFSQWDGESYYVHSSVANDPVRRGVVQLGGITKDQWETQFIRHSESWLLGYHGDERLDAMLRKGKTLTVSEKMEDVLSSDCYVLKGDTGSGTITLWIDPDHGYNAAKVETHIRSPNSTPDNSVTTRTKLENVLFKKIDDVWVPMEADSLKQVDYYINGKKGRTREQSHHKRTQFLLNPDHDALGSFADPFKSDPHLLDETTVHGVGDSRSYLWQDGKLIPQERRSGTPPARPRPRRQGDVP